MVVYPTVEDALAAAGLDATAFRSTTGSS